MSQLPSTDTDDIAGLLDTLRRVGGEPETVEVKNGSGGFPRSLRETLVAFANGDGGTVIVGVDESAGFAVVGVDDAMDYRDRLIQISRDDITPALHIGAEVDVIDGRRVLVSAVPASPPDQKPVYVTSQGIPGGAYVRVGDGDRHMTDAEIGLTYAARSQPRYDTESVDGTTMEHLDRSAVLRTLQKARTGSTSLRNVDDTVALCRMGVLTEPHDESPVTVAGLLSLGDYPQAFFPQLMVSVVVHPPEGDSSTRFLDNVTARGNIPAIVSESMGVIRRNLAARAEMSELGRSDQLEYPLEAVREALVNALLHRDYSAITRGTQVQVDLHPDRLVVRSPGGLYGGIAVEDLGEEGTTSSRNAVLASLLTDTFLPNSDLLVAENRASGIPAMIQLARRNGLPRPVFASNITSFVVTMNRSQLLGPEARAWIASLDADLPTPSHEVALAMLRTGPVTNAMLREWGADRIQAGQVLRYLVDQGVAVKEGGRRCARYQLDRSQTAPTAPVATDPSIPPGQRKGPAEVIAASLRSGVAMRSSELAAATGFSRVTVIRHLKALIDESLIRADGAQKSPRRTYQWVGDHDEGDQT